MKNNKGKAKQTHFKNPFDIDPDQDELIQQVSIYKSSKQSNIINPLPFNPYTIQKQSTKKNAKQVIKAPTIKNYQPEIVQVSPVRPTIQKPPKQLIEQELPKYRQPKPEKVYELNQDGDPPLLQDIGIDPEMIFNRAKLIFKMSKPDQQTIQQSDLSGPILIALCFGMLLLLSGKIHFGDIYAIFVIGNILLYLLFNFMSQVQIIPLYSIMSTLGYAMIPLLLLGLLGIFFSMKGGLGIIFSLAISAWSSLAASNFIEALMKQQQQDRRLLLMYPLFLFYVSFALIIIF